MLFSYAKIGYNVDTTIRKVRHYFTFPSAFDRQKNKRRGYLPPNRVENSSLTSIIKRCFGVETALCCLVEYLAYPVDMVSNGSTLLLLIVNQVDRIKQFQVINLTLYVNKLSVVHVMGYYCQVNIRTGTIVALRPGAE